ncbi:MAG: helix-hairpin-helix domain-containing protein [Cytophagales bacterium]|nr:helix-hairpin-helix domain-containing protein [Cytophagales bacterium]
MKRLRYFIHSFFGFSRTETNAFVVLIPLIILILFSEPLYIHLVVDRRIEKLDFDLTDSLLATLPVNHPRQRLNTVADSIHFFQFDPNTLPEAQWIVLGLPARLATRITRYRNKGGRFRKTEDLLAIYQMDTSWFLKARPWVKIHTPSPSHVAAAGRKMQRPAVLDINTADSLQLLHVYGIGPTLSKRIRTFREKLGGFVFMSQLKEVYGLDSTVIGQLQKRFLVSPDFRPKTINVNTAGQQELASHPYITQKQAQAIVAYRFQHGPFGSFDQVLQIQLVDQTWLERISPYLSLY